MGALGAGDIGPNLSGLFSQHYPKTFRNGEVWSARNLRAWLKNPREIREWARMQPVVLTEKEMKELEAIFPVFQESTQRYLTIESAPSISPQTVTNSSGYTTLGARKCYLVARPWRTLKYERI
jgi:hypothetical protein